MGDDASADHRARSAGKGTPAKASRRRANSSRSTCPLEQKNRPCTNAKKASRAHAGGHPGQRTEMRSGGHLLHHGEKREARPLEGLSVSNAESKPRRQKRRYAAPRLLMLPGDLGSILVNGRLGRLGRLCQGHSRKGSFPLMQPSHGEPRGAKGKHPGLPPARGRGAAVAATDGRCNFQRGFYGRQRLLLCSSSPAPRREHPLYLHGYVWHSPSLWRRKLPRK